MKLTEFNDKDIDMTEEEILIILRGIYNKKVYAEYVAGSLLYYHEDKIIIFQPDIKMSNDIDYMIAKLYLQNKTENHHYWNDASETVKNYKKGELTC